MRYKKIDDKRLRAMDACKERREFVVNNCPHTDSVKVIEWLIKKDKLAWAHWLIVRVMSRTECLAYVIYSAKQVLPIFEKRNPDDTRPRKAIEAAEKVLKRDTKKNREAARSVSFVAYNSAHYVYYATAAAAHYAAHAAHSVYYAYYAYAAAAEDKMRLKLLRYGIKLLKEGV